MKILRRRDDFGFSVVFNVEPDQSCEMWFMLRGKHHTRAMTRSCKVPPIKYKTGRFKGRIEEPLKITILKSEQGKTKGRSCDRDSVAVGISVYCLVDQ